MNANVCAPIEKYLSKLPTDFNMRSDKTDGREALSVLNVVAPVVQGVGRTHA